MWTAGKAVGREATQVNRVASVIKLHLLDQHLMEMMEIITNFQNVLQPAKVKKFVFAQAKAKSTKLNKLNTSRCIWSMWLTTMSDGFLPEVSNTNQIKLQNDTLHIHPSFADDSLHICVICDERFHIFQTGSPKNTLTSYTHTHVHTGFVIQRGRSILITGT